MQYPVSPFLTILSCLLLALAPRVYGGGFESAGLGARATAMGGAFIGVADDWTAIYWNPAGLTQLKGRGIATSIETVHVRTHDSSGLANPTLPLTRENLARGDVFSQFSGEPTQFNGLDSHFTAFLPGVGFYWRMSRLTLATGSYSPLGFAFDVRDLQQPGYDVSFQSSGFIADYNVLTTALDVVPGWSLGAGLNVVQARLERSATKKTFSYSSSVAAKSTAWNVQGVFGTLAKLGRHVRLGAVYRMGHDLDLKGNAHINDSRLPGESSEFNQKIRNPTTYGIGLAVEPTRSITLSADWQRTQWAATRFDVRFDNPGVALQNQNFHQGWESTSRYRFGAEWRPFESWSFRAGYFRDPRAVAFESQALTGLIDPDTYFITAGLGYQRRRWHVNVGNQFGLGEERLGSRLLQKQVLAFVTEFAYQF
jgi:long-chain fatty acid transport protein